MTDPNLGRPLWQVMRDAYVKSSGTIIDCLGREELAGPDREEFAVMIHAIAGEVDSRVAQCLDDDPAEIATWLRAQADEAGRS